MNILYLGNEWNGSNSKGLAEGFRKLGHCVYIINEERFNVKCKTFLGKLTSKIAKNIFLEEYHSEVILQTTKLKPDLIIVFKGSLLQNKTINEIKKQNIKIILFYPDVSLFAHNKRIPKCIPYYDHIFTTKTFMIDDLLQYFNYKTATFIPHAADVDIHRPPLFCEPSLMKMFTCDVSYIANYSKKKEEYLSNLVKLVPNLDLKIWGPNWEKCSSNILRKYIKYYAPHGDLYANAIFYSKINLSILSEARKNSSSGDLITSRTFHIPASKGFMLHERTSELLLYFEENKDVACFDSIEELAYKIKFYLENESDRNNIKDNGYTNVNTNHTMKQRAEQILSTLKNNKIIT